jgi:hypothetical protein
MAFSRSPTVTHTHTHTHTHAHAHAHPFCQAKEIKRTNLIELNEVMCAPESHGGPTISEAVLQATISMVEVNIIRDFSPATPPGAPVFDPEEDFYFDPRWAHLQHVYSLLSNILDSPFVKAPFAQQCITRAFVRKVPRTLCPPSPRACSSSARSERSRTSQWDRIPSDCSPCAPTDAASSICRNSNSFGRTTSASGMR